MAEGDPVSEYDRLALALQQKKTEYLINVDPGADPAIEAQMESLRDELVALLDDSDNLRQIAEGKGKSEDGFVKAREGIRNKNVQEWKGS